MMMEAIYAGMNHGSIIYQKQMEDYNQDGTDYKPVPGRLWEVGQRFYTSARFLRAIPDDSLIKIFYDGLPNLPGGDYVIIFMVRDPEEIKESVKRTDAHLRATGVAENKSNPLTFNVYRPYNKENIDHVLSICEVRRDFRVIMVNYKDVIEDPEREFRKIKYSAVDHIQVDIDIEKAAAKINPELYRNRKSG
jgi:hypothetical protein